MNLLKALAVPTLAVSALMLSIPADAQSRPGGNGYSGRGSGGGYGRPSYSGGGGHYHGGGRHYAGGRYYGGYYGGRYYGARYYGYGYGYYRPYAWAAWAAAAPIGYYWGWGYPYGAWGAYAAPAPYYYPAPLQSYPVEPSGPPAQIEPSTEIVPGPGAPTQYPLYQNFCPEANAFYPKVTSCPGGWQLRAPQYQ